MGWLFIHQPLALSLLDSRHNPLPIGQLAGVVAVGELVDVAV